MFALALIVSEISTFEIFDLKKVGQGHVVNSLQRHRSMANVKVYKRLPHIFALALTVSEILTFTIFDLEKEVMVTYYNFCTDTIQCSNGLTRQANARRRMFKCQNQSRTPTHFCASSHRFIYVNILFFYVQK